MNVSGASAFQTDKAVETEDFANAVVKFFHLFLKGHAFLGRRGVTHDFFSSLSAFFQVDVGNVLSQLQEFGVAGNGSAFAKQFDNRNAVFVGGGSPNAFFSGAFSAFFDHLELAFFTQNCQRLFGVAVSFSQSLFAVHHRQTGFVTERFNQCSSNFSHCIFSLLYGVIC